MEDLTKTILELPPPGLIPVVLLLLVAPPYVEVGAEITTGSVLGLVEIMKCFNQITYGGPGLPQRGRVAEILAEDAAEVRFDQVLFRIKPI
jgi:acetyl-CoA carboxylase biotin carboxyl carrier protein